MVRYRPVDYDPFAPASRGVSLKPVDYDPFAPKKKPTDFVDDMQRGAGQAIAAVGSALRDVPIKDISTLGHKAEEYGNKVVQANPADMPSVQEIKSVSDAVNYTGERVAELIPQAAAPLAAAGLATLAGAAAPIAGAASFGVGALSGFGQAYGGIREDQREQGIEDKVRAAAFATPSAALDAFGVGRFIPGSKRILGDIIETGLRGIAKTGARVGAEEGVTEVAQTALERAGALKSLTDEEALAEYLNSLAAGVVGGNVIGAGGATVRTVTGGRPTEVKPPISGTFETEIGGQPARANVTQDGDTVTIDYGNGNVATVNRDAWDTYVSGGAFAPVTEPEVEPETGVPATSFGAPSVSETPPAGPAGPTVTIDAEEVIIEQPDGSFQVIPRAEWEATQGPAPAPVAVAEPVTEPAPAPVSRIFQPSGQPAPEPEPAPPPPSDDSRIFKPSAPAPVRISMPPYVRPPEFKVGRPAPTPAPAPAPAPTTLPEAYAPILQEYQAIVEKPTPEATDRLKASTVRDIPTQDANMTMSVVPAPDGTLLALPGRNMILGWQRQLQGEPGFSLRSQTIDQFYDYEGTDEVPLQVTRPAVVDASGTVIQRGILGKPPTTPKAPKGRMFNIRQPDTSRRPDLVEEPRNTDIDALIGSLPPGQRVNVRAQLDRIMDRYEKNKDVGMLLAGLDSLRRDVGARIYRNQLKRARPLVRGFERAMEVLYRAERDGLLTPESAALARWLIQRNPRIADNLAFSFQAGNENSPAGDYTSITRVARIFAGGADGLTAAHEILHHTERMMPEQIREGIRAAWRNRIDSLMEIANRTNNVEMRRVLGAIVQAYYGNEQAQRELAEAFREGSIPYSVYHLSNPSEFWAVNASELLSDRASRAGWVGAARNWLRDFIESAKDFFGLPNNAAVLRGLRAVLAAESGAMTGEMLANQAVVSNINAQPSTPQQPPSGPQQSLFPPSQLPPSLTLPKETRGQRYSRKLVDRFERLRVVQSLGQLAAGIEGFYEAARKFDSRAGELMQKFERDFGKKIKEIAREAGFGMNDIDLYLYSKAAPEINADFEMREIGRLVRKKGGDPAIMTKVNGTNPNFDMNQRERDWTPDQPRWSHPDPGIDAAILAEYKKANTTLLSGSGISNKDAFDEVDPLENGPKGQAWKDIANVHRDSVKWALDNDVARGVKSRKVADEMFKAIPHYVPVKGKTKPGQYLSDADFALMDDQGDSYEEMMSGGSGFSITKNEWRQRRGRKTLPFSPYGTFVSDIGARIVRGERNRVGQKMMDFFIKNPSNEWRVFSDRNPPRDRNGNIRRPDPRDPNFMVVKRGGETFYLRIEDPLLQKAAKNLNPTQINVVLRLSSNLTRILARSLTTVNPDFFLPNFFRDLESAALNLGADSPGLLKAFSKNVKDTKAIRSVAAFEYGNKGGDPALRDLYEQFKLDGGSVSWVERETPQEAAARIQKDLKTVNDSLKDLKDARSAKEAIDAVWNPTSKGFRAMVGALESTNATFENSIRFAAYRAALDVGMSRDQAAMIARESTVDFNRRGEAGAMLNALYVFFNAGIQGTVRTARALSNNPFKTGKLSITQAALLSAMATAATLAAANAGISGEDDDGKLHWDKIPDYEKQRNLIIMNPLDGKTYAKIPMPYGFGFFPYLATRAMDAARTGEDLGAVGLEIMSAGLSNFSPIQFSAGSIQSSVAKAITPTLGRPFVELMLNENFMAKPIYNEPFDKGQSYASVARFNTPEGYKELSRFLNDISGGEGKVKGELNFPAESFEYLTDFALGGVGNLAKALYKTGEEGDVMAAPVVKRLVGQPGKGRNVGEYYEREEKARSVNQQLKDSTIAERAALKKKFPVETSPRVQSALTDARSTVVRLNKEYKRIQNLDINEGVKAQRLERLREQIDGAFVRFNRTYNQVEQATR